MANESFGLPRARRRSRTIAAEDSLGRSPKGAITDPWEMGLLRADELLRSPRAGPDRLELGPASPTTGETITVALVGDLLLNGWVQRDAERAAAAAPEDFSEDERAAFGYASLFADVAGDLRTADLTIANLETPLCRNLDADGRLVEAAGRPIWDNEAYTGYPAFNAHPGFAGALRQLGVDIVSTANNHSLDRGPLGIDLTLDALDAAGIEHIGTARAEDLVEGIIPPDLRHVVSERRGVRVGVVSATQVWNRGRHGQVSDLTEEGFLEDLRALRARDDIDIVIAAVHWGEEYQTEPSPNQRDWAHRIAEAGADVVAGHHPHVLQPIERIGCSDDLGARDVLVFYSLGNFIANQGQPDWPDHADFYNVRSSAIVYVDVHKPSENERAELVAVEYLPVVIDHRKPTAIRSDSAFRKEYDFILRALGYPGNVTMGR